VHFALLWASAFVWNLWFAYTWIILINSVLKFGRQKDYKSQHSVLESASEERKVIGCIANWKSILIASSRLCRKRAIARKIVLNFGRRQSPIVWVLDLYEIGFLITTQICLWLGLEFGSNIFLLHYVSAVPFRLLLFRCGATQLRIVQIILTLSFEDIVPVWGSRELTDCPCFLCSKLRKKAISSKLWYKRRSDLYKWTME